MAAFFLPLFNRRGRSSFSPLTQTTVIEYLRRAECPDGALVQRGLILPDDDNDRIGASAGTPQQPAHNGNHASRSEDQGSCRADWVVPGQIAADERDEADQHHRGE
ncbi:MAG: hypothetical protein DMD96_05365 [Candidatus Rokuibacteriota bacterium]|nr:MAG: hypothetical protein DMD96_05365 [Candidatus Rokubacteria bacterium]